MYMQTSTLHSWNPYNLKMAEREQAASSSTTAPTSNILQTADNVLNTVGDKLADMTGQHETVQKSKPPSLIH